jgi:hypothetical protein
MGAQSTVSALPFTGEFDVADDSGRSFRVDDLAYSIPSAPGSFPSFGIGASFRSLTGVVHFTQNQYKLVPRGPDDAVDYVPPGSAPAVVRFIHAKSGGAAQVVDVWAKEIGSSSGWTQLAASVSRTSVAAEGTLPDGGNYDIRVVGEGLAPGGSNFIAEYASASVPGGSFSVITLYGSDTNDSSLRIDTLEPAANPADATTATFMHAIFNYPMNVDAGTGTDKLWSNRAIFVPAGGVNLALIDQSFAIYPVGQTTVIGRYSELDFIEGARTWFEAIAAPDGITRLVVIDDLGDAKILTPD